MKLKKSELFLLTWLAIAAMPSWAERRMPAVAPTVAITAPLNSLPYLSQGLRSDKAKCERDNLPQEMIDALPKEFRREGATYTFIKHDLNNDGDLEYIVQSRSSGSGGSEYSLLQKTGRRWKNIGYIQGGFNISTGSEPKAYENIETWSRHGQIHHTFFSFSRGKYRQTEAIEWPKEFDSHVPPFDTCR